MWTRLEEQLNTQHQLWRLPINYPRFRMIMQLSMQSPKKQPVASSLGNNKKRCVFNLPENQWDRIENSLTKCPRIQPGTSNVTCSCTCSARPCEGIFWVCYWGNNRRYRQRTVRRNCRRKLDELATLFKSTYLENPIANKKPPFLIEMWNQYDAAGQQERG